MSTILLVDDEPEFLDLYTEILELMDHRVVQAHDGHEALKLAHVRRPDLVVTDWQMPRMSGVELCQQLIQDAELSGIPIIMHSAEQDPHAPGVTAFLSKCSTLSRFEEVVNQALTDSSENPQGPPSGPSVKELSATSRDTLWKQSRACGLLH
ncbi:response regulator [Melittangium boletus]|uniref:Phosphate regulon response regulator PhoB n=1 Tax=Melittangium boletus DSM 14713 TaxID=1294270 RepID=A0A250IEG6_9BACT|nr:response regulator [Melittangium boletus]ATB30234.1 phosphate regulon response regulator PhoB [Melittangium boletus DSM 14713]